MKERPILFSSPMIRAILAGVKTQTRRIVKGNPIPQMPCPYGVAGDRLWVRESFRVEERGRGTQRYEVYFYRADEPTSRLFNPLRYKPSIHMPRALCRIVLEVTAVRVERLQAISEADAIAEGVVRDSVGWNVPDICVTPISAADAYGLLWDSVNGSGAWDSNPWVWVVEFKRATP